MRFRQGVRQRPSNTGRRVHTQAEVDILMIAVVAGVLGLQLPSGAAVSVGVTGDGQLGREGGHQEEILGLLSLGVTRQWSAQVQILAKYNSCLTNTFLISKKIFFPAPHCIVNIDYIATYPRMIRRQLSLSQMM